MPQGGASLATMESFSGLSTDCLHHEVHATLMLQANLSMRQNFQCFQTSCASAVSHNEVAMRKMTTLHENIGKPASPTHMQLTQLEELRRDCAKKIGLAGGHEADKHFTT